MQVEPNSSSVTSQLPKSSMDVDTVNDYILNTSNDSEGKLREELDRNEQLYNTYKESVEEMAQIARENEELLEYLKAFKKKPYLSTVSSPYDHIEIPEDEEVFHEIQRNIIIGPRNVESS